MKRALALAALLAAAGCSKRLADNYKHCLKLRVGMTTAEMVKVMGEPEETIPYVEGRSLAYLKGRTAFEWSNPASMPGGDHVSLDEASGKIESIRCSNSEITASVYAEPPAPSSTTVSSATAAAPVKAPAVAASTAAAPAGTLADALAAYRKKDLVAALKIVNPLAGAGDPDAELLLGMIFFTANKAGMKNNVEEAMRWFYQASRQKNCEAAALYATTIRERATPETVVRETLAASELGCPAGKLQEAALQLEGYKDVLAPDAAAGEKLLLEVAQGGSAMGQLGVGRGYRDGKLGGKKDLVQAYRWTLLASRHPIVGPFDEPLHAVSTAWTPEAQADAAGLLKELEGLMTPAQRAEAKRLAGR